MSLFLFIISHFSLCRVAVQLICYSLLKQSTIFNAVHLIKHCDETISKMDVINVNAELPH